jgi:hypothetical protein
MADEGDIAILRRRFQGEVGETMKVRPAGRWGR